MSALTGWVVELFVEEAWWPQRLVVPTLGPTIYASPVAAQAALNALLAGPGPPKARDLRITPWPRTEEVAS